MEKKYDAHVKRPEMEQRGNKATDDLNQCLLFSHIFGLVSYVSPRWKTSLAEQSCPGNESQIETRPQIPLPSNTVAL